ncbi:MAG: aminoglycoside phosphotransferase family protein [Acidiferrobacterales bacterium]
MDTRLKQLYRWLDQVLDVSEYELKPASADASFRRYFRLFLGPQTLIVMDAPPDRESLTSFTDIAKKFFDLGLNVPEIIDLDHGQGFMLLSDLGSTLYLDRLNTQTVDRLYGDAMGALVVLQAGTQSSPDFLPDYNKNLLIQEMRLFTDWYLARELGVTITGKQQQVFDGIFEKLANNALAQPQVWVHRDYHSRNLMVTNRHNPGILDFQDAVRGAVTYDLVSLLRDCYVSWPQEQIMDWVEGYHQLAQESGIPVCDSAEQFQVWFDRMGVQRHLKAVGIFSRLCHRDGKNAYLNDIPRTMKYIWRVCEQDRELARLASMLTELGVAK